MKTFKIVNDDLVFNETMNLVMVEGVEELKQSIERILTTNINEWFLNIDFGLDYDAIRGKGKTEDGIKLALREAIFQDNRIADIEFTEISLDRLNRHLTVRLNAITKEGQRVEGLEVVNIG